MIGHGNAHTHTYNAHTHTYNAHTMRIHIYLLYLTSDLFSVKAHKSNLLSDMHQADT